MMTSVKQLQVRKPISAGRAVRLVSLGAASLLCALGAGCLAQLGHDGDPDGPSIVALSTEKLSIGSPLEVYGANFAHNSEDYTVLRFDGTFTGESGQTVPVENFRMRPHWVDGNRVVWAQVGPFSNPFSANEQLGTFQGEMVAINVDGTGAEAHSRTVKTTLEFTESIVIRVLRPINARCGEPVKRLLGGFPYEIEVEAVGFDPINFTYAIAGESKGAPARVYRQPANSRIDSFGHAGELTFAEVPDDVVFYLAHLTVSAMGADGKERSTALDFAVHRPIEYMDSGKERVAETMAPKPDSGCIGGGPNGRSVTYTETQTETRDRQIGVNWSEAWNESSSTSKTLSHAVTEGIRIENNGSETQTSQFGWSSDWGGSGGVNVWIFQASLQHNVGSNGSYSTAYTNGWSVGRDYSTTDTESWAYDQSRGYTLTKGGQEFWTVSSSNSKSLALTGEILSGQYGVFYRQTVRLAIPGALIAYNACGNPTMVGETAFIDYNWSVDLAAGPSCPPLPQSTLPEAACYVPPCSRE